MRVLGIDPGTAICGFGIIENQGNKIYPVKYGVITTPAGMPMSERLEQIYVDLSAILSTYKPDYMGVEELFFNRNVTTAMTVSQARGVILLAGRLAKVPLAEYTPLEIKQGVVGYGRATKHQVIDMTMRLLNIQNKISPDDAADALAVAICTFFRHQ